MAASIAVTAPAANASTPLPGCPTDDCFKVTVGPSSFTAGSSVVFTLTLENKSVRTKQDTDDQIRSANITPPAGFTVTSVTRPATGTATVVGGVIQFRSIYIAELTSKSYTFTAGTPSAVGAYTFGAVIKETNNFSGSSWSQNTSSALTVSGATGYKATASPSSFTAGSSVVFAMALQNTSTTGAIRSANITAPAGFTVTHVDPPDTGTATIAGSVVQLRSISVPSLTTKSFTFSAQTPSATGSYAFGVAARDTNDFSGSDWGQDPSSALTVTAVTGSGNCPAADVSCGEGFIDYATASNVCTGTTTNSTTWLVGCVSFPASTTAWTRRSCPARSARSPIRSRSARSRWTSPTSRLRTRATPRRWC